MPPPSDPAVLPHLAYNVFLPPQLPQAEQPEAFQQSVDLAIVRSIIQAGRQYQVDTEDSFEWAPIELMLGRLCTYIQAPLEKNRLSEDIWNMRPGDTLSLYIRAQNAGLIIRLQADYTTFEAFEVQAETQDVMSTPGKVVRHFPGPAVQVPNSVDDKRNFINEIANILEQMNTEIFDEAHPKSRKARTNVRETRNSINPNYFIQFFFGYLRGMGTTFDPARVVKRLGDEVLWMDTKNPWRRSPIWLIVRVALQTSLGSAAYKQFMVYHHASILSECCKDKSFSSDLLYTMRVKMAKRLYKLGNTAPQFLVDTIEAATSKTQEVLQGRWKSIQSHQAQSLNRDLSYVDFHSATHQTLPNSRGYLERVFQHYDGHINPTEFTPNHCPRLENVVDFSQYANGGLSRVFTSDPYLALFDFEASVFDNLAGWTSEQQDYGEACQVMASCFQQYLTSAKPYYTTDIADQSIMMLTLMRVWMAIDQLATKDCPLLHEFPPELPNQILDPLLLRTAQHIQQARLIQDHIYERYTSAFVDNPSIFADKITSDCFAVQYFRSSPDQQDTKLDIERNAEGLKLEKIKELKVLNAKYDRLSKELMGMACEYFINRNGQEMHSSSCRRCRTKRERDLLKIYPYEWTLPPQRHAAEAVVFELRRPDTFIVWRDITYKILVDLSDCLTRHPCNHYSTLKGYDPLSEWRLPSASGKPRITIASWTQSFTQSHYGKAVSIPARESEVCLDNALNFKLYDSLKGTWASEPFVGVTFAQYGAFKLPKISLYRHLEYAVQNTTHTSNQVLADQYDCPKELSLHEHIAFGTLRSGARLQWMNIARGLEEDLLSFSSDEVRVLHTQAAWQIGPLSDDGSREWHEELESLEFGRLLVSQCKRMLDRVKASWLQVTSVSTIVMLVTRLLASSPSEDVVKAACAFLREARDVAYRWVEQLKGKLQHATDEKDIIGYQQRVCEMAIICHETYDVDPQHMGCLLSNSNDFIPLIKSSITLYDNSPPRIESAPATLQVLLCRNRRFAHKVMPYILGSNRPQDTLNKPLREIWPDFRPGPDGWRACNAPNERWVTITTARIDDDRSQRVHLNLLTGQLLIDGQPLGRLPRQYVEHPTYLRLFGQKILHVVPAKSPGMAFATRDRIHGYQVSFALERGGNELIIQAQTGDCRYELVPHKKLSEDFPLFFSEDYHHWADIETKIIEFRPTSSPWSAERCEWFLRFSRTRRTTLEDGTGAIFLIDIHSPAFKSLSHSIQRLESDRYLHITYSIDELVNLELPRMKLSFFVNQDYQLESRNFREQVLDENQSAGTLFGLKNQLVIQAKGSVAQSLPRSRSVLIPDGEIGFTTSRHHVSVSIETNSSRNVDVYRYKIDEDLGQLSTDAGLTSRLFKIYLHALTSHCLPDPLTGRTGTEEALDELSQASSSSFEQIDVKQAELLKAIGLLTPKREYYPAHLECMQTTRWINLPFLSQHFAFSFAAAAILRRADTLQLFHPSDFKILKYIGALRTSDTLLERAIRQTAIYYPPDTTGYISQIMESATIADSVCPGRDELSGEWGKAGQAAKWASGLVYQNWGSPVYRPYDLVSLAESWYILDDSEERESLSYRSSWFNLKLSSSWITFYNLLRHAKTSSNRYALSACLASIAFGQAVPIDLIPVFLAFATNPEFASLAPPSRKRYQFRDGYAPSPERVKELVLSSARPVYSSPAGDLLQGEDESDCDYRKRKQAYHNKRSPTYQSQFVDSLMNQWPRIRQERSLQLRSTDSSFSKWINTESALDATGQYFSSCIWNIKMRNHLQQLEGVLASRPQSAGTSFKTVNLEPLHPPQATLVLANPWNALSISSLLNTRRAPRTTDISLLAKFSSSGTVGPATNTTRLANLFAELQKSTRPLNRQYGIDLDQSRMELDTKPCTCLPKHLPRSTQLYETREDCSSNLARTLRLLNSALSPQTNAERMIAASGVWPRLTPRSLLQQLSFRNRAHFNPVPEWRAAFIRYAQVFADYQRSQRLVSLVESRNVEEFYKELDLASNSCPDVTDPDWLLVQIDGDFGARAVQRQVAREMISPTSRFHTVLQLNMGEGKSSVIVPIIASSLANSSRLVRVVVLKPLWRQMFDLLVSRVSGLSNRRIYYLPFSRHLTIDTSSAQRLRNLYEECMREGGILLAQPEHILSFKLMGIDRLISSNGANSAIVANILRETQNWLKTHSRDILDESDEILHVRYQLVYTSGQQQPLDNHPDRWTITQQLLHLAATHVERLHNAYPESVMYKHVGGGQFPTLRIMPDCPPEVEEQLIVAIATDVRDGRLLNLNCDRLHPGVRDYLVTFFTRDNLPHPDSELLRKKCDPVIWKGLLLVRGLLASGILVFTLKRKHYRVDYGLDVSRSLLAVPYRAKDLPSLRAEFGHPDVAVALTCLSYYYQGLTTYQLNLCFELLYKLDNPSLEYEQWVNQSEATPDDLQQLNGVNIKDRQQFTERLVPTFSRNSATIDFFLSSAVFPKEAKEFPEKLATSGWDLAERKSNVTTGFSGTNDNRYLLPTSITQADPVGQLSTNALVLTYLLQPENNYYMCTRDNDGQNLATAAFLRLLVTQKPEIRVLLDLDLRPDIEAAVYFNNRDELVALPRNGTPVLLKASPFAQRLDKCVVYLDDAHTRGTDLKLPRETRALVTLGPKVTKDRLLQGCMRMRKLGHGQSVMFAAPPEIDTQIRNASPNPISPNATIDVLDILRWAMLETCKDLQHHVSHWAQQGIEYDRRQEAENQYENGGNVSILAKGWTTPEARSLEDMYGVFSPEARRKKGSFTQRAFGVPDLRRGLELLGIRHLEDPSMDEEQEREVNHEVEREQQIQRPPKGQPSRHSIHPDVDQFITTGTLPSRLLGILPLFHPFRCYDSEMSESWSPLLFASVDFLQTIDGSAINRLSEYMRPVNWIVRGPAGLRVVLSPHEVNELLPLIQDSSVVRLHVYAPRVSLAMLSFSDLRFYSIPTPRRVSERIGELSATQLQLDLFAGQLYLSSYQDYMTLCATLGLSIPSTDDSGLEIGSDGFVDPRYHMDLIDHHPEYSNCVFMSTPIPALKDLIGRRRKGMKYQLTHVGKVLNARRMTPEDF